MPYPIEPGCSVPGPALAPARRPQPPRLNLALPGGGAHAPFLARRHDPGRDCARGSLAAHADDTGHRATSDLAARFT